MKYLRLLDNTFVIWEENTEIWHSDMASLYIKCREHVKSAGFVRQNMNDKNFHCYGKSESLGLESLPEDTYLFNAWIQQS
jgi:hypothetical protein